MSRIPIESLANGVLFSTVPFVSTQNPTGAPMLTPAEGKSVQVYAHGTTTPATVFVQEAAGTTLALPLTTGVDGSVPGWIDPTTLPLDLVVNGVTYVLAGGGGSGGGVATFNTRSGAVALTKADVTGTGLTAADVGADVSGVAGTEQTRALAAEALLAPLASPALTGNPTVPTQAALANSTRAASTAYADAAVLVEKTRSLAAEATFASGAGLPSALWVLADPATPDGTTDNTAYLAGRLATAISLGATLRIPKGTGGNWVVSGLTLPSNARVDATGATFQLPGTTNNFFIVNTSVTLGTPGSVRDTNITWNGGTFVKGTNQTNTSALSDMCLMFGFVDGLTVNNVTISQSGTGGLAGTGGTYGMYLYNVTRFRVDNYSATSASQSVNQSTLQMAAACQDGHIKHVTGTFGDDMVAITPRNATSGGGAVYEIAGQVGIGDCRNIVIEDVFGNSPSNGVRILGGSTAGVAPFYSSVNITVRNVDGNFGSRPSCAAVYIGGASTAPNLTSGFCTDILVEKVYQQRATVPAVLFFDTGELHGIVCRSCLNQMDTFAVDIRTVSHCSVKVCDADYTTAITSGSYFPVRINSFARRLVLENVRVNAATTGTAKVAPVSAAGGSCGGLFLRNVSVTGKAYTIMSAAVTVFVWAQGVISEDANGIGLFETTAGAAVTVFDYEGNTSGGVAGFVQTAGTIATKDSRLPGASGTATLVAGTVVVSTALATASSQIRLTNIAAGGTLGDHSVARGAGTFTINSNNAADTSTLFWEIVTS